LGDSEAGGLPLSATPPDEVAAVGVVRDTPSWKGASVICILLGV
jgi:hypothetical protein